MTPLMKRLTDAGIALAVSAAATFLIIAISNSLVAKASVWKSFDVWAKFVSRPDIVATALLVIGVTMAVSTYQRRSGR
jgi:cytochrome c biogenesis factor